MRDYHLVCPVGHTKMLREVRCGRGSQDGHTKIAFTTSNKVV